MAKLIIGENDLKTWCKKNNRENLLIEWDYNANNGLKNKFGWDVSTPDLVMPNSHIKVSWICEKGHKYEATIGNRTVNDHGCPFCSGSKLLIGYNDFETWCKNNGREDLLKEWNYEKNGNFKPEHIAPKSGKKVWWKCSKCGYEWLADPNHRSRGQGCPECANNR